MDPSKIIAALAKADKKISGNDDPAPLMITADVETGKLRMQRVLVESPYESHAAAKYCLGEWKDHETNVLKELNWLQSPGSQGMSQAFKDKMFLMVMEAPEYERFKGVLTDETAESTRAWMIQNRKNRLVEIRAKLAELQGLCDMHEQAAGRGPFKDGDGGDNGPAGAPGLAV